MDTLPPGTYLCAFPAGKPPEGHIPNFADPATLGVETLAIGSIFLSILAVLVTGCLYANRKKMKAADCRFL